MAAGELQQASLLAVLFKALAPSANVRGIVLLIPLRLYREFSGLASNSFLQTRNDSKNRAIPENGRRRIFPALALAVENHVIPEESFLHAAVWLGVRRLLLCGFLQRLSDQVLRIPELQCAQVRNSRERASAWTTPIGGQDGFPNDKDPRVFAGMPGKEFLGCGGPPQTVWSGR